jgi:prepilin-type N-terminal cleavage/methylation domain-containing protein
MASRARSEAGGRGGRGRPGGFTLLELMVVIMIIGLLVALLAIAMTSILQGVRFDYTQAFIINLKQACETYRQEFGSGSDYPPMKPVGSTTTNTKTDRSSANLTNFLGRSLDRYLIDPGDSGIKPVVKKRKPLMSFTEDQLDSTDGDCLVDAWGRRILYYSGKASGGDPFRGHKQHDQMYPSDSVHIDIVSDGPYPGGVTSDGKDCRIATFKPQSKVE